MSIDIDKLTEAELIDLNNRIVERTLIGKRAVLISSIRAHRNAVHRNAISIDKTAAQTNDLGATNVQHRSRFQRGLLRLPCNIHCDIITQREKSAQ